MVQTYGTMYYVKNMKDAVTFHTTVLGMAPTMESPEWTEFNMNGHKMCLHIQREDGQTYPDNGILIVKRDGLKSLFESMKNDKINVFGLHEIYPGAWTFDYKDKDNNIVSFHGSP